MKKGINSWCFPQELTMEEIFKIAKDARFDTIELNMSESIPNESIVSKMGLHDNCGLTIDITEAELEEVKRLSFQYDLPISSIATALHWTYPLTSINNEHRKMGMDIAKQMINTCAFLGGDTVLIVPGIVTEENSYERCYELAKQSLLELAAFAETKKIVIGVENVWNKFLLSPLEMRQFIDEINHPYVKVYFDAGNVLQHGFPEQWVRILGNRIKKIHIKDFRRDIGNIQGFTSLLEGDMKWSRLMDAINDIGYQDELICELVPYREDPEQLVYNTSNAMDYIIKSHNK